MHRWMGLLVGMLLFWTAFASGSRAQGVRRALIIASGQFDKTAWSRLDSNGGVPRSLEGSVTDAKMIADLLIYRYGMSRKNIRILGLENGAMGPGFDYLDRYASRDRVFQEMKRIANETQPEDYSVVYYSGHGDSIEDFDRKSNSTQYLVCHDGPLFDFEIDAALGKTRGHMTIILDDCFSGGGARSIGVDIDAFGIEKCARGVGSSGVQQIMARRKRELDFQPQQTEELPAGGKRVLMAACERDKEALELHIPGYADHPGCSASAFTLALYQVLLWQNPPMSYAAAMNQTSQWLANRNLNQSPQLEGGQGNWPAIAPPVSRPRFVPVQEDRLQAGRLAGVRTSEIYKAPDGSLFRTQAVGWFDAAITAVKSGVPIPDMVAPYLKRSPRIADMLRKSDVKVHKDLDSANAPLSPDAELNGGGIADGGMRIEVKPGTGGNYEVYASTSTGIYGPVYSDDSRKQADLQADELQQSYQEDEQFEGVLNDIGGSGQNTLGLKLTTDHGNLYPEYRIGEWVKVRVDSKQAGYLLLIAMEPDGTMSLLYPNSHTTGKSDYIDSSLDLSIQALRPAGLSRLTAVLTSHPLELPQNLIEPVEGLITYTIPHQKVEPFIEWMKVALTSNTDQAVTRNLGIPDPLYSPDEINIASLDLVVSLKKE